MEFYSLIDFILTPIYLVVILGLARYYSKVQIEKNEVYRYYFPGLLAKIIGGIGLALVYTLYYPGGDTVQYFRDGIVFQNLFFYDIETFWKVFVRYADVQNFSFFNQETGYPAYCDDQKAWTVVRLVFFIIALGLNSFLVSTILCATFSFLGVWQMYRVYTDEFPGLKREMAISFLFVPSVFFWGSGMLKDTFTLGALGFLVWGLNQLVSKRIFNFKTALAIVGASFIIVSIKPYILVGLLPAVIVWLFQKVSSKIKAPVLRLLMVPVILFLGSGMGFAIMSFLGESLGEYKIDTIFEKALVTQRDLKREYYEGNSFDIGDFEATLPSIVGKFPIAVFSAIFRPLIIESNNIVMFISGLENLVLLIFTIRILFTVRFFGWIQILLKNHLLLFSIVFALIFAFSVGLTTSNFGSLVRYKIPGIPFFVASLYLFRHLYRSRTEAVESS